MIEIYLPLAEGCLSVTAMGNAWQIRGGRIIDPAANRDEIGDLFIEDGRIVSTAQSLHAPVQTIDARGLIVAPGFIDLHVHFREPGNDEAETILTGSRAAARGGFTTVVTMPNTSPAVDSAEKIKWQIDRAAEAGLVRLLPTGSISADRRGRETADLAGMKQAGAAAFTDDGSTVFDDKVMQAAIEAGRDLGLVIMDHALDPELAGRGVMHEGAASSRLGLPGISCEAEARIVKRDIDLAEQTGGAVHIQHVSSRRSVELIRAARLKGIRVSGEATPHHLTFCDVDVQLDNTNFKMSPPLRSMADREAICAAVADGTLEAFATDHAPHREADKAKGFMAAPFGVIGLETAIGVTYTALVRKGLMEPCAWIERWTCGPARILGISKPSLAPGSVADVVVLDLDSQWTVRSTDFVSKSRNTPFEGTVLNGQAVVTLHEGIITSDRRRELHVDTSG